MAKARFVWNDQRAMSVLIVDDHAPFRALARRLLTADGFDIVGEAADGASAIDALTDIIIVTTVRILGRAIMRCRIASGAPCVLVIRARRAPSRNVFITPPTHLLAHEANNNSNGEGAENSEGTVERKRSTVSS